MTIYLAPLTAIIGVLAYALSASSKIQELGRIAFFCGLLITLMLFSSSHALSLR
jgi:Na+/phosphate symporter